VSRTPAGLVVTGTARDPDATGPTEISVEVNGRYTGSLWTSVANEYSGTVPPRAGNNICVVAINRNKGDDRALGCRTVEIRVDPIGHLDNVLSTPSGLRVRGWTIDPDTTASASAHIYVDGDFKQSTTAAAARPDVGAAYPGYGNAHGFDLTLPAMTGHPRLCAYGINVGPGTTNTALGCAILSPGPPAVAPGQSVLTVATFNIIGTDATANRGGYGSFNERLDELAAAAAGFDVVGLQEVDSEDQARRLAERAGYPYYTVGIGVSGRPDQAFLSRSLLTGIQRYEGPKTGCVLGINCGGPVWILVASVNVNGTNIRVVNTHVSGDYNNENGTGLDRSPWRAEQARFIKDKLVLPYPGRVVVVGDFNGNDDLVTGRGGPLIDSGAASPTIVPGPTGQGHCDDRIDLILARPPMAPLAYDGVYGGFSCSPSGVSDHPRVAAVLTLGSDRVPEQRPSAGSPRPPSDTVCRQRPWTPGC
jgi:hypothetical protein